MDMRDLLALWLSDMGMSVNPLMTNVQFICLGDDYDDDESEDDSDDESVTENDLDEDSEDESYLLDEKIIENLSNRDDVESLKQANKTLIKIASYWKKRCLKLEEQTND
ncbi:MAG: hypothetical protein MJZ34_02375 [Paludibacteraceae bacterium]|nr:hypothetical protein [Paludibacteraceae bacterium]